MLVSKLINIVSRTANWLAVTALCAMFLHIIFEIILRNFFDKSTFVLDEFVGYAVSAMAFLALGETFRNGALIQVSLVRDAVSWRWRLYLELFGNVAAGFVGIMLFFFIGRSVLKNITRGTLSSSVAEVPQFIPEGIVWIGVAVFLLRVVEAVWHTGVRIRSGESQ